MNAKHTPGPWTWHDNIMKAPSASTMVCNVINDDGCTVYRDSPVPAFQAEIEANKHLIAAAPDLLSVLEITAGNIRSLIASCNCSTYNVWLGDVESAIAKAKGGAA